MERWTVEKYRKATSKYNNRKTIVDGIRFDSKMEANRYCELVALKRAGEIQGFGRQPSFIIMDGGTRYIPDFIVCGKNGEIWVEDVKGYETEIFKLKQRQWNATYPWLDLRIVRS